jgi:hypothetical protein
MGGFFLFNYNPFLWPLAAALLYLALVVRPKLHAKRRSFVHGVLTSWWAVLLLSLTCGFMVFEAYYYLFHCRVSDHYTEEVVRVLQATTHALTELKHAYWLDYATLLCALRHQYNVWDHDQDISIMKPGGDGGVQIVDLLRERGLNAELDESRDLIQIWATSSGSGPHTDIWMWEVVSGSNGSQIITKDASVSYRVREASEIFPLQLTNWTGHTYSIPHDPHAISSKEFDHFSGKGSYMTPLVFHSDCFHNFVHLRWLF